ncbi:MAG: antibiotic biosynthesis monooxygenase [Syntrophus sp. (in: bacteria)]|nr:antibiotic biosynthesis monooxygenase [Syntrophus sp. (in: bacteria)]
MIHVLATVELAEGKRPEFLAEFEKVVPSVRAEKGCSEYGPAIDISSGIPIQAPARENTVVIIEKWSDLEALKAHLVAPHMKTYRDAVKGIVKGMTVQILKPA